MMFTVLSEKKPFGKGQEGPIGYNIRLANISLMSQALAQIENLLTARYGDEVLRRTNGRYTYHTATNLYNTNQQTSGKRWEDSLLAGHYFRPLRYDAANMLLGVFFLFEM